MRKLGFGLAALAAAAGLVALFANGDGPAEPRSERRASQIDVRGQTIELPLGELMAVSKLVVVGEAVAVSEHAFSENPDLSAEDRAELEDEDPDAYGRYLDYSVAVEETLKGDPAEMLSVRLHAPYDGSESIQVHGGEPAVIEIGERRVFFLFRGQSIWAGGWLVGDRQRSGAVAEDGSVTMGRGIVTSLAELRKLAAGATKLSAGE